MAAILRCPECKLFTMKEKCALCNVKTVTTKPGRYHPGASYTKYRREAKKKLLKKKGLY